jgi:hypothetical protein
MPVSSRANMPTDLRALSPLERNQPELPAAVRHGVTRLTVDVPAQHRGSEEPKASRWKTPEFLFYYIVFVLVLPWMIWVPISLSKGAWSFTGLAQLN